MTIVTYSGDPFLRDVLSSQDRGVSGRFRQVSLSLFASIRMVVFITATSFLWRLFFFPHVSPVSFSGSSPTVRNVQFIPPSDQFLSLFFRMWVDHPTQLLVVCPATFFPTDGFVRFLSRFASVFWGRPNPSQWLDISFSFFFVLRRPPTSCCAVRGPQTLTGTTR